jgi:VWFA-related protein
MKRIAVLVFFIATAAFAQLSEKVNVSLIEVPVTVADGSGNPVRGLTAENFVLSDDRGKHPIATFDAVDFAAVKTGGVPPSARRNFLLLFDLSNTTPNALERARRAAQQFVGSAVHPSDLAAVGTISVEHGFRLVTAFTTDRALLAAAIESPLNFVVADPLGLANGPSWTKPAGVLTKVEIDAARCFS